MQSSLRDVYGYLAKKDRGTMTHSSCIHQHHRGINSNYSYHTKHSIGDPSQCRQKYKHANVFPFCTALPLSCPLVPPNSLSSPRLISLRNTKSQKEILLMKEQTAHLLCRGPELGIPTAGQNEEYSQLAESLASGSIPPKRAAQ